MYWYARYASSLVVWKRPRYKTPAKTTAALWPVWEWLATTKVRQETDRRGFLPASGWNSRFAISGKNHFNPITNRLDCESLARLIWNCSVDPAVSLVVDLW